MNWVTYYRLDHPPTYCRTQALVSRFIMQFERKGIMSAMRTWRHKCVLGVKEEASAATKRKQQRQASMVLQRFTRGGMRSCFIGWKVMGKVRVRVKARAVQTCKLVPLPVNFTVNLTSPSPHSHARPSR